MAQITMIACVSRDRGLGKDGKLIWQIPEDMKFFKKMTTGHIVVMGHGTYTSIGRPLPERENVVLSHSAVDGGVKWVHSQAELEEYLSKVKGEVFIIGGASLYEMFLSKCQKIYLTEVNDVRPADVYFPKFDFKEFDCHVLQGGFYEGHNYDIVEYTRKES